MSLLLWFVDLPVAYLFNNEDWKSKVEWILSYTPPRPRSGIVEKDGCCVT
jgi:hypothetical protein